MPGVCFQKVLRFDLGVNKRFWLIRQAFWSICLEKSLLPRLTASKQPCLNKSSLAWSGWFCKDPKVLRLYIFCWNKELGIWGCFFRWFFFAFFDYLFEVFSSLIGPSSYFFPFFSFSCLLFQESEVSIVVKICENKGGSSCCTGRCCRETAAGRFLLLV